MPIKRFVECLLSVTACNLRCSYCYVFKEIIKRYNNLHLSTGQFRRCYSSYVFQDIFKNPDEPIRFLATGIHCGSPFCMNFSHFMSLGVIPEIDTSTYAELRNRKEAGWYTDDMMEFLSGKLYDSNEKYNAIRKMESDIVGLYNDFFRLGVRTAKRFRRR